MVGKMHEHCSSTPPDGSFRSCRTSASSTTKERTDFSVHMKSTIRFPFLVCCSMKCTAVTGASPSAAMTAGKGFSWPRSRPRKRCTTPVVIPTARWLRPGDTSKHVTRCSALRGGKTLWVTTAVGSSSGLVSKTLYLALPGAAASYPRATSLCPSWAILRSVSSRSNTCRGEERLNCRSRRLTSPFLLPNQRWLGDPQAHATCSFRMPGCLSEPSCFTVVLVKKLLTLTFFGCSMPSQGGERRAALPR
mmetsp:Transcript_108612/g.307132  ORF Transcript_108612/g.307132 Transcript_108612/m.307132 type:complete len:248 (+) Transcript_108612:2212-2955(+)